MKIFVITDKNGKFMDCGTAHIVVVQFALMNKVENFACKAYDDVGFCEGEVDLPLTKLKGKVIMRAK